MNTATFSDSLPGSVIQGHDKRDWLLLEVKGRGAFSTVFSASSVGQPTRALKLLEQSAMRDPGSVVEFHGEGAFLSKMRSAPNVIGIEQASASGSLSVNLNGCAVELEVQYHLLALADGSLDEVVVDGTASWRLRLDLFRDVVCGIHQMHCERLAHRDLKSSNVLLLANGTQAERACVTDLGRSTALDENARFPAENYEFGRGDRSFSPPELLLGLGQSDPTLERNGDLYALGSVLAELAVGQGATSLLLPDWRSAVSRAATVPPFARTRWATTELERLYPRLASVAELVGSAAPRSIRVELQSLFQQLCDPIPHRRSIRQRRDRNLPADDLAWLIRRVDILRQRLRVGSARST